MKKYVWMFWILWPGLLMSQDPFSSLPEQSPIPSTPKTSSIQQLIPLKHMDPEKTLTQMRSLFPELILSAHTERNLLLVSGASSQIQALTKLLTRMDQKIPVIQIQVQMIELSQSGIQDLGLVFENPEKLLSEGNSDLIQKINFLMANGEAKLKSAPRLFTLSAETAQIRIGDRIPYSVSSLQNNGVIQSHTEFMDTGFFLKILPKYLPSGQIHIQLQTQISSVKEWKKTGSSEYPLFSQRETASQITTLPGQTLIFAGLIKQEERELTIETPFLSKIPFLGELFKSNRKEQENTDILFLITPKIEN